MTIHRYTVTEMHNTILVKEIITHLGGFKIIDGAVSENQQNGVVLLLLTIWRLMKRDLHKNVRQFKLRTTSSKADV